MRSGFVNITNSFLKVGCTKGKTNLQFSSAGYDLSTVLCLKCGSLGMHFLQLSARRVLLIAERVCKAVNPRVRYKETGSEIQKFCKITIHPRRLLAMEKIRVLHIML